MNILRNCVVYFVYCLSLVKYLEVNVRLTGLYFQRRHTCGAKISILFSHWALMKLDLHFFHKMVPKQFIDSFVDSGFKFCCGNDVFISFQD